MKLREVALVAAIIVAYAISLGRTVAYDYVWDDLPEIAHNPAFDRPLAEGLALTQTERAVPELADLPQLRFGYDSYRPLLYASYWLDIRLWGRAPGPLHAVNVVLGAIAIAIAYLLARRWLGSSALALVPTALFALHPAQIEAVAYVSGRGDVLAGLFALLAAYACLREGLGWTIGAALAFVASLAAKEAYVALPLAVAALALTGRTRWTNVAVLAAVALAYLTVRQLAVGTSSRPALGAALIAAPGIVLEYLRIVVLPFDLSIERVPRAGTTIAGWAVVALALAAAFALRRRALPEWARTSLAGLAWFVALLAPSAIVVSTMNVVADRYLYAPLLGAGVALATAGGRLAQRRPRVVAGVAIAWAALVLVVAWREVTVWRDVSTLYRHAAELAPDSSRAQYRVAYLEIARDRWDLAVPRLERALELDPANVQALNNLGVYRLRTNQPAEAEALLARAVTANPARFNAWLNLGLAQHAQGKRDVGCASLARALAINPRFELARQEHARLCK